MGKELAPNGAKTWWILGAVGVAMLAGLGVGVGVGVGVGMKQRQVRNGTAGRLAAGGAGRADRGDFGRARDLARVRGPPGRLLGSAFRATGRLSAGLCLVPAHPARPQAADARLLAAADAGEGVGVPHRLLGSRTMRAQPSIVVVGDGLTESAFSYKLGGWAAQLGAAYIRKVPAFQRGGRRLLWGNGRPSKAQAAAQPAAGRSCWHAPPPFLPPCQTPPRGAAPTRGG
jgi:hypothetical protein